MKRLSATAMIFATMLIFWLFLNGSLAGDVLLVGVVAALFIALLFRGGRSPVSGFRPTPRALAAAGGYLVFFLAELVRSNLHIARVVLTPTLPITPAIVKVRTRLKSPMGRLLLANSITLTPGTLTVELEGEWLYIHWVNAEATDIDAATAQIVAGFEKYLEVMYG